MTTDFDAPTQDRRRWRRWAGAFAVLLTLVVVIAWSQRRDIAAGYIDDALAARGVPARYAIADLGFGRQRLTNVVIGEPARPDLTADWVETITSVGFGGARVTGLRAGQVRLRGRIVDGRLSLGALDRLLPASGGGPLALPDVSLDVADARLRLNTPVGEVGLKLAGEGHLRGGFRGTLAAVAPRLTGDGCAGERVTGYWQVAIRDGAPRLTGPTRAAALACSDWRAERAVAVIDVTFAKTLDALDGSAWVEAAAVGAPRVRLTRLAGNATTRGRFGALSGAIALGSGPSAAFGASAARAKVSGTYRTGASPGFTGDLALERAALPSRWRNALIDYGRGTGTPLSPLIAGATAALVQAGRDAAVTARLALGRDVAGWRVQVAQFDARSASGAALAFAGGDGLSLSPAGVRIDGRATARGAGLPTGTIEVAQAAPGAPLTGRARFEPYAAGGAQLALTPVTFRATPGGRTQFATQATLSGPLGAKGAGGRIDRATLPVVGGWDGGRRLVLNPGCVRGGFDRLAVAGLVLNRTALGLCPVGRALVMLEGGRLGGGARISAPRLTGILGGSPLTLAAAGSELRLGDGGFRVNGLAARLGAGATPSRLDLATLTGRITGGGVTGSYAGGAARIGAVPLLLSEAAGEWRLVGGALTLGGNVIVSDAAAEPRFNPLASRDVRLSLANGLVRATGTLTGPVSGVKAADVAIRHRLSDTSGVADVSVPGITFGERLQPTALTRLTLGVIAEVKGTISGVGQIRWNQGVVSSDGDFRTDGVDLAAAFGPVTGLKGQIHFTDLLALESAPGQIATVATINPGVAIADGTIRYRLLAGPMVQVEDARWPFSGGELRLEPTLLDYSREVDKRMTFRVTGLDAGKFLQGFDYKNLDATGVFDGTLPMVFDATGGRITDGRLVARSGGTLAYVGEVSEENLGFWGNLAFGALRSLRYRSLELKLYGPLAGNVVTEARFGGVAQGQGAKSNFLIRRLARLPFVFNIKITAPFRALIDSARSFYDPTILIQRNLPALLEQADRPVQPPASVPVPQEKPD